MAKASTKKPKLSQEEQMAELARLTGSVAAISHIGTSQPFVLPGPGPETAPPPATSAPEPAAAPVEAAPAEQPAPAVKVAPIAAAEPTPQPTAIPVPTVSVTPVEPKGEKAPAVVAPVPPVAPAAELPAEDDQDEEEAEVAPTPTGEGKDKLDFTSLFADSAEKKTFQVRITASHQQFFQQMGLLLGGGASSTDVIHNILAQFKAANEGQIQKAFQRQLRQMMSPKK